MYCHDQKNELGVWVQAKHRLEQRWTCVIKGCIWNSKGNCISVSKKRDVTEVNSLMIKDRSWILKDMDGSLRNKEE